MHGNFVIVIINIVPFYEAPLLFWTCISIYLFDVRFAKKIDGCPDGTSILECIFEGVSVYYNYTGDVDCFELDDDPHGLDGWNWQV